ncbi:hypothetical protein HOK021_28540 [Streptomyces hygroscopicus]|nr:hypothetical protein HOK021_28540 [Streptomyces hygroscopicus]
MAPATKGAAASSGSPMYGWGAKRFSRTPASRASAASIHDTLASLGRKIFTVPLLLPGRPRDAAGNGVTAWWASPSLRAHPTGFTYTPCEPDPPTAPPAPQPPP